MLKLRFQTDQTYNSKLNGVKKIVFDSKDYLNDDYILFVEKMNDNVLNVNNILTTNKSIYQLYSNEKHVYAIENIENIENGTVIRIENSHIKIMNRPSSNNNAIFMTKRCNHYCLMCSEPPTTDNDSYLVEENMKLLELMEKGRPVIGITGGEPTLDKRDFIKIIEKIRLEHPDAMIRLLTNGRSYKDESFVKELSAIASGHLISEIPIYDSDYRNHDYIVQARNAFHETIKGMYNCFQHELVTDVRIVLTKQNYQSLSNLVTYIYKNMPFVAHIAFMSMEYIGFAMNNFEILHINPNDYREELKNAIKLCETYKLPMSVYNLPMCMMDESLWPYARQSISDWKNEFDDVCLSCEKKEVCSGMFSSTYPHYREYITPILSKIS